MHINAKTFMKNYVDFSFENIEPTNWTKHLITLSKKKYAS